MGQNHENGKRQQNKAIGVKMQHGYYIIQYNNMYCLKYADGEKE